MRPGYAVIGIFPPGGNAPQIMSVRGKIVVFDTPDIARQWMPRLGNGRVSGWDVGGDTVCFTPLDTRGVNRACVLTDYDPYQAPAGLSIPRADGGGVYRIRSETHGREWKHHIIWSLALTDCGQMALQPDGTWVNTALEE